MINKQRLLDFIDRYHLGGIIESVTIAIYDSEANVKFVTDSKDMLGDFTLSNSGLPDGNLHIYMTSKIKQLMGVLGNQIDVSPSNAVLKLSDGDTDVVYVLAIPSTIPSVPELKHIPNFSASVDLNGAFIDKFNKATSAMSDADTFTLTCGGGKAEFTLGYSSIQSDRISISVKCDVESEIESMQFNTKHFKSILLANRDAANGDASELTVNVSSEGLLHIHSNLGDYVGNYYLVQAK